MIAKLKALCQKLVAAFDWLPGLVARITVGWLFMISGWGKIHNLDKVTEFFRSLGIPAAEIQAPFVASVELVCGALVLIGLFTRIASIPLIGTMVVALMTALADKIHSVDDLFSISEFLYIPILLFLVIKGPGAVSVDRFICGKCDKTVQK